MMSGEFIDKKFVLKCLCTVHWQHAPKHQQTDDERCGVEMWCGSLLFTYGNIYLDKDTQCLERI